MPVFSIVAVTTSQGVDEGEMDALVAEFDDVSEAKGYARRQAEETHGLAAQLDLDFDYSHVTVYAGEVEPDVPADDKALVGVWLFASDGVDWASAEALMAPPEAAA